MSVIPVSLYAIMSAIASQIEAALKPELGELQVLPHFVIHPTPPCIDVYPAPDQFLEQSAYGHENQEAIFTIRARVTPADSVAGQMLLLELLDPRSDLSVIGALAADASFGGAVDDSSVQDSPTGFIPYPAPGGDGFLLGSEWRLRVVL